MYTIKFVEQLSDEIEEKMRRDLVAYGGSFFHPTIGFIMDAFWTGVVDQEGVRQYAVESYCTALMIIPLCALLGACMVGFVGLRLRQNKFALLQDS